MRIATARQRAISVGLLALLVAVVAGAAWWLSTVAADARLELEARTELLATLQRAPLQRGLGDSLDVDRREPYLTAESETIAAAALQTRVRGLVENAGGIVFSTQVLQKTEGEGEERRLEVQVVFEATIEATQAVLHGVESGSPIGFVDEFTAQPARLAADTGVPSRTLRVGMTVTSFWRRPT
jgi:hypothetical protein